MWKRPPAQVSDTILKLRAKVRKAEEDVAHYMRQLTQDINVFTVSTEDWKAAILKAQTARRLLSELEVELERAELEDARARASLHRPGGH